MFYAKDILNKVKSNGDKSSNEIIMERTKGTATGALIGGGIGIIYAFAKKKSYLVFGMIGILAGGLVSNVFINKEIKKTK